MGAIRCPFCHEYIDAASFNEHQAAHLELQADGQHKDYVTLPPEARTTGDLSGVPRWYEHAACGEVTGMPDEIIRSYLQNPYLYMADRTFCHGCEDHVPLRECHWHETGENLQTYMDRLRAQKPHLKPRRRMGCMAVAIVVVATLAGVLAGVFA